MAEENKLQLGGTVNGDLVIIRADSAEELAALAKGLAEVADPVITDWSAFKQAALAKGIFTGDQNRKVGGSSGGGKAADSAPPSGGTPTCKHGPMKDLGNKYRNRWYCKEFKKELQCDSLPDGA